MTQSTEQERAEFEKAWRERPIYMGGVHQKEVAYIWWMQAARRAPAVPVPRFNHPAKRKLELLTGEGATITGYAFQSEGRRGSIDCHGFVYWWQDSALVVPQGWKLVPDANNMTDEQAEAICNLVSCCGGGAHEVYEAALAAAPQPPEAAPVELPEPVYTMRVRGRMHDYTPTLSAFDLADGEHELYTEQQVRALLEAKASVSNGTLSDVCQRENIREGAPYDNPAFEALARALGVWGTAQSAVCAQFWIAAKEQST